MHRFLAASSRKVSGGFPAGFTAGALVVAIMFGVLSLIAPQEVQAQRQLPDNARYGRVTDFAYPSVMVEKKLLRMSPGGKIYSQQNLIIMPVAMPRQAEVLYQIDINGAVSAIWLLTAPEAQFYKKRLPAATATPQPGPQPAPQNPPVQDKPDPKRLGGSQ